MVNDHAANFNTETISKDILSFSRDTLLVNLRFLDCAFSRLSQESYSGTYATDGYRLLYDQTHVISTYKTERTLPARNMLHTILHCVFQHICVPEEAFEDREKRRLWDISCDIACEYTISVLDLPQLATSYQNRQNKVFTDLSNKSGSLTAEKIYRSFIRNTPDEDELVQYESLFKVCEHSLWTSGDDTLKSKWKEVSLRMQVDMETFTRQRGKNADALFLNLRETNRTVSDYAGFLRKFATRSDGMKLNPDEFDYALYSYGMQLSGGRFPMIEETEYRDPMRIRDLAMAIFAHDILSQEKVKLFLINTWEILSRTNSFSSKVRLHILLPSKSDIPGEGASYAGVLGSIEDKVISSSEEMQEFVRGFTLPEVNGNDFRPVFDRVRNLVRSHTFINLRGLLILTEDVGRFPPVMPAFPGAIIYVNNDYSVPPVPPWALRLVLQGDEL